MILTSQLNSPGSNMQEPRENRRRIPLEQRVTEILVGLIAAGILWIGSSIVDLKTQMSGLAEKYALRVELQDLRLEVQRLREKIENRRPL